MCKKIIEIVVNKKGVFLVEWDIDKKVMSFIYDFK